MSAKEQDGVVDLRADPSWAHEPFPLTDEDLSSTWERAARGASFRSALEQLLLELPDDKADLLMLLLREGRAAWLPLLAMRRGDLLFVGNAFSGSITALALQGFDVTVLDPSPARARFAALRARHHVPGRVRVVLGGDGERLPFDDGAFAHVVKEDGLPRRDEGWGFGMDELFRVSASDAEVFLTADNRLGYKRSLGKKGEFRVPGPFEFARLALRPLRGERSLGAYRRALSRREFVVPDRYALYPHQLDFSHVVGLDGRGPTLTIGPMEKKNRLKLLGRALGLFPVLAPSFGLLARRGCLRDEFTQLHDVLQLLAERLGEPRARMEQLVATRGNSAVVHTAPAEATSSPDAGRWTLHIPLAPKNLPQTERHFRMLGRVREQFPRLPVPEPLFFGELGGLTFSCERRLAGWTAPQACGDQPRIARMLGQVAEHFAELVVRESRPIDEATFDTQVAARFRLVIEHAAVPSTIARLEALLLETRKRLLGRPMPLVLYHADLRAKHVQVDEQGNVLGFLDWGTAEDEGLPYYDLLQLLVHEIKQEHGLSAGAAWRRVLAGELRDYERACLASYQRAIGLDAGVARAIEEMYPVLVAAMAEKNWDYSRPRWLHRQFGL